MVFRLLCHIMACFCVIYISLVSNRDCLCTHYVCGDCPCAHYVLWRLPLCTQHFVVIAPVHTTFCGDCPCVHYFDVPWPSIISQWAMMLLWTSIVMSQWVMTLLCVHHNVQWRCYEPLLLCITTLFHVGVSSKTYSKSCMHKQLKSI